MPPKRKFIEKDPQNKRQVTDIASDVKWCIGRGESVTFESHIERFCPLDQRSADQRYELICRKHLNDKALEDFKIWTKTVTEFMRAKDNDAFLKILHLHGKKKTIDMVCVDYGWRIKEYASELDIITEFYQRRQEM
ncbi:hypothetical protein BC940DRAFT_335554 [Gongronella butleri]|nr:hypothetical protein BC940DRAFT_335554 [Gongronella butleri]